MNVEISIVSAAQCIYASEIKDALKMNHCKKKKKKPPNALQPSHSMKTPNFPKIPNMSGCILGKFVSKKHLVVCIFLSVNTPCCLYVLLHFIYIFELLHYLCLCVRFSFFLISLVWFSLVHIVTLTEQAFHCQGLLQCNCCTYEQLEKTLKNH